jgi:hypothetical protein
MSAAMIGGVWLFTDFMQRYGKISALWLSWIDHLWICAADLQPSVKNHTSLTRNIISRSSGGSFRSVEGLIVMLYRSAEQFSTLLSWRSDFTRVDFWITQSYGFDNRYAENDAGDDKYGVDEKRRETSASLYASVVDPWTEARAIQGWITLWKARLA